MDQTLSLIMHGCNLARQLEANLPHLAHNPELLSKSCDDILTVFLTCKDRLSASSVADPQLLFRQQTTTTPAVDHSGIQQWLRTAAMERFQAQVLQNMAAAACTSGGASMGKTEVVGSSGGMAAVGGSESAAVASSSTSGSQQRRRRRDEIERRTIRVPVPRIGNTEVPPEDGFTWRKYGQKEILGSTFPRGYFRCTHQKLYRCPAKKQVQRLDNDPDTYEVTYRGQHTCHMSATAPSVAPPDDVAAQLTAATTSALHQAISAAAQQQQQQQLMVTSSGLSSASAAGRWALEFRLGAGGEQAGPSSRYGGGGGGGGGGGRDHHHHLLLQAELPVTDMAAAMFSSGSSSTNSMDLIFNAAMDVTLPPAAGDLDQDHDHHDEVKQLDDRGKGKLV